MNPFGLSFVLFILKWSADKGFSSSNIPALLNNRFEAFDNLQNQRYYIGLKALIELYFQIKTFS